RAGAPREHFPELVGPYPKAPGGGSPLDGIGRDRTSPVLRLEGSDQLARAEADRIAVGAKRAPVDPARELCDLGARHTEAEVGAVAAEPLLPGFVEDLGPRGQQRVDEDVLGAGDVPHESGQRVEILPRTYAHLLVGQAGEGALCG